MGILFESFVLPFVIILSIPFAFLGTYWILYATGTPFDVMAGVGLIMLVGIVVNNAIVLVDRVNIMIRSSQNRHEALVEAGRIRLRPITMTAMTTIGGLIPMAVGATEIVGVPYAPLGRTVIGGLITATIFTVYVVPIAYTLIDDLRNWFVDRFTSPSP
jgi:HAE1 family hydrophobic/amphiphilic exporter-1